MPEPASEQSLFLRALELPPADRAAFLDDACRDDPPLRADLDALLAAHDRLGGGPPATPDRVPTGPGSAGAGEDVGTVLSDRYKLVEPLGAGGMGAVWMAQQSAPVRRLVAVKVVKAGMDSRQVLARFEAERQALALMDHPNIARVLDAGTTTAGRPYFVMELVKGVPITRYCDEHRLTPKQRLELFVPVCQAIQHAHQKGVIHRDVKPSNVLVALYDGRPVPKVIDFGVAKAAGQPLTDRTLVTGFGAVVGTLEYMSPEQAEVNQLDIDTRSDIYSLGVLLYELLTGSTPLDRRRLKEAALLEVLRLIRDEEPPRPSARLSTTDEMPAVAARRGLEPKRLTGAVRGDLDWIVMKALEKDRTRRYETANGFALDVQRYLADEPVQACPPSVGYRLRKFVRRNRWPVLAASLFAVLVVAGLAGTATGLVRARASERRVTAERDETEAARRQTRQALNTMTDEVVEDLLGRQPQLTEEHRAFLTKVLAYHTEFAAAKADDPEGRKSRADGYARVGRIRRRLGDLPEAEAAYREALALRQQLAADFPTRRDVRHDLASSYNDLGILLRGTGRPREAEAACGEALALQKRLVADVAGPADARPDLAASYNNLANLLGADGSRRTEAEAAYRDALALWKQLAADFPERPDYRLNLARGHNSLGTLLVAMGRPKEAKEAFGDALAVRKQLAADFPKRSDIRNDLAGSHNSLALFLFQSGQPKEAEGACREALAVQKQLVAEFPSRPDFLQLLASIHTNLGGFLREADRLKEAEGPFLDALAIHRQLAADFPTVPDYQNGLAAALVNLALLNNQRRQFAAALPLLDQARPYHKAALDANPQNATYREFYRNNFLVGAESHLGLGDHARAAAAADELARFGYDPASDCYDAACFLCRAGTLAAKDTRRSEAGRQELARSYADRALVLLRQAVALGYTDAAHMKQVADLESLRGRGEFKKLVGDLEAKARK